MKRKTIIYILLSVAWSHVSSQYLNEDKNYKGVEDRSILAWCCPTLEKTIAEVPNLGNDDTSDKEILSSYLMHHPYAVPLVMAAIKRGYGKQQLPMGFFASRGKRQAIDLILNQRPLN